MKTPTFKPKNIWLAVAFLVCLISFAAVVFIEFTRSDLNKSEIPRQVEAQTEKQTTLPPMQTDTPKDPKPAATAQTERSYPLNQKLDIDEQNRKDDEELKKAGFTVDRVSRIARDLNALAVAITIYKNEFNVYPQGDSLAIMKALTGNNPKKTVVIEWNKKSTGADGALLDPWGTPYQIKIDHIKGEVEIRSAGSDRVFGNQDDKVQLLPQKE